MEDALVTARVALRSGLRRRDGRALVPIVIALLAACFLAVVVYQAMQTGPGPEPWSGQSVYDDEPESVPSGDQADSVDSARGDTKTGGTTGPVDASDAAIRAKLAGFFARMPADAMVLDTAGKLDLKRARDELEDYLETLGPEAVDTLVGVLEEETDFVNRRFLLRALGNIGTDAASNGLLAHYHRMASTGQHDSEAKHTIKAMGRVDSPHSFDQLLDLVETSGDPAHRHFVLEELGGHHMTAEAVPVYKRLMVEDTRTNVRSYAARALKRNADPKTAPDIELALKQETNRYVRQTMIGALGGIRDANSVRALEEVTQTDDDHVTRMSAVNSLKLIGGPAAESVLERVAENDANERVRADAQRALQALRDPGQ